MSNIVIAALYHFTKLSDHKNLQAPLIEICNSQGIKGSLLLAFEGINGTIAGSRTGIDAVLKHLRAWPGCSNLEHKESHSSGTPFKRMKVKLKQEIVTMGQRHHRTCGRPGWHFLLRVVAVAAVDAEFYVRRGPRRT